MLSSQTFVVKSVWPTISFLFYFQNWCDIPSETKGNKKSQSCNKVINKRKHTHIHTHTNILVLRRTHNWAIFRMRERKERRGSSQWNRPQDPELQSSGASSPPEHTTLLEAQRTAAESRHHSRLLRYKQTRRATCFSHTHTMSTYMLWNAIAHTCLQAVPAWLLQAGASAYELNMSSSDGETAHDAVS